MLKLDRKEEKVVIIFLIFVIVIFAFFKLFVNKPQNITIVKESDNKEEVQITNNESKRVYIYITGEIKNPGMYCMSEQNRISDVVDIAGGFTENADIESINLAEKIKDEQHICIQEKNKTIYNTENSESKSVILDGKININIATAKELDEFLPGIGEVLSNNIVNYRNKNGKFKEINDLTKVDGIGSGARFEKIKELITIK